MPTTSDEGVNSLDIEQAMINSGIPPEQWAEWAKRFQANLATPAEKTPSEAAAADNAPLRQLLALAGGYNAQNQGISQLGNYTQPISNTMAMRDLVQGGPYDPRAYAYGPTKAGPYVFFPTPAPRPDYAGINTNILASGLTNAINNYLGQRQKAKSGG
jgi:hypothetical protein